MTSEELRQAVANLAASEEHSVDSSKYWREVLPRNWKGPYPKHWCGAFALWNLRMVLSCQLVWDVKGVLGATQSGFLHHLPITKTPDIGDVCYMDQPYQHHAILGAIGTTADGLEFTISHDGNSGPSPGMVLEQWYPRKKWTAFYSIQKLIDAKLAL